MTTGKPAGAVYPTRDPFFSNSFVRLLTRMRIANEIGADGAWCLAIIVFQEDATFYTRPVTFWDDQLADKIGVTARSLRVIRSRLVEAGWLHYEPGRKGVPGRYWVLLPEFADSIADGPSDDHFPERIQAGCSENSSAKATQTGLESDLEVSLFNPTHIPTPKESARKKSGDSKKPPKSVPEKLRELINGINALPDGIMPRITKPDSPTLIAGWSRVNRDPEAASLFSDVPALLAKIRGSPYLQHQPWFRCEWLFKKDQDRVTWNVSKIMNGNYVHANNSGCYKPSAGKYDPSDPVQNNF